MRACMHVVCVGVYVNIETPGVRMARKVRAMLVCSGAGVG